MDFLDLFRPLGYDHILVPEERVFYSARRHWSILLGPGTQALAGLVIATYLVAGMPPVGGNIVGILLLGALAVAATAAIRHDIGPRDLYWAAPLAILIVGMRVDLRGAAVLATLFLIGRFAWKFLQWSVFRRLYLTDRRIVEVDSFLGIRMDTLPLTAVTDVSLRFTPLGEVLGYGEFRVESAGQDQALATIANLDRADEFHHLVIQLAAGSPSQGSTPLAYEGRRRGRSR